MNIDLKNKSTLLITKQLNSYPTKSQAKVTILGTDRTTFVCALTMALRRYVSEIIIFDQSYNRQMKMCFHDLACAFQLCPISRSVNLIYTSDITYTSRSDVILINEICNSTNIRMKQQDKISSLSLKQNAEQLIDGLHGVAPYDYNSLVVQSLAGNGCHAGQICGLGSSIYNHRLRYAISELLDISSKHITGFTQENTNKSIEPYWPSITINGHSIQQLNEDNNKIMEEYLINQSISNNAPQDKYQKMKSNTTKNNEIGRTHLTQTLPTSNIKKIISHHRNISHVNEKTSIRIQQWLYTNKFLRSIKNNHDITKQIKHHQKTKSNISNNATNIPKLQTIQDQLIKHLNGWHCLQTLYHRPYYYTLAMNLSQITHSIINNSQEILILSAYIQPLFQQQFTNQIELTNSNQFASIPILIRHYGIHAIINYKSQIKFYNHMKKILEQNNIFRNMMNYPLQKTFLIYDYNKTNKK